MCLRFTAGGADLQVRTELEAGRVFVVGVISARGAMRTWTSAFPANPDS